jgi:hypothetical protein
MKKLTAIFLIVLALGLFTTSSAQGLSLKAIAPQVGVIFPEDPFDTGFQIGAKANLGELTQNLALLPYLNYWSTGGGEGTYDWSLSNFQIGADVHYGITNVKGLYVGGGLSINFISTEATWDDPYLGSYSESTSSNEIGIDLLAGYEFPLAGKTAFVEGKYDIISDLNTLVLNVGLYFDLK